MTATIPRRAPEIEDDRSIDERIAELEALIKEARRRARRRRATYAAVMLVALAGVFTGAVDGGGGVDVDASVTNGSPPSATSTVRVGEAPIAERPRYISAIHVDPRRPKIVYASTLDPQSVMKSMDAGKTWSVADEGLTALASPTDSEDLRVDALALDPRSPNVLYAGTGLGVFKTTDGAKTWKLASTGIDFGGDPLGHRLLEGFIWAIAIDPSHTSTVYAAGGGVWKSTNGGATWKRVLRHSVINLGIDPTRPDAVYASVINGPRSTAGTHGAILKTTGGGGSWRATGPRGLRDNSFGHPIVVDRRAPGMIYAGGSRGLFVSANQGRSWKRLLPGGVGAIAIDPSRANVLYVAADGAIVKSEDGGQTWSAPRLDGRGVSSIAIASTRPQTIYAGVYGGIFASTDGGASWRRLL